MLSNVIRSQDALHAPFGGVVPEIAARAHLQTLVPVIERALENAGTRWEQVDGVAVTRGPGLVGCLLVGVNLGQAIAWARKLPVIGVSHLAAHVYAGLLEEPDLHPPVLGLVVSGGHSDLIRWRNDGSIAVIGRTLDDAAGEAFDKGARILGLPFPGGPAIDALAATGDPRSTSASVASRRRYSTRFANGSRSPTRRAPTSPPATRKRSSTPSCGASRRPRPPTPRQPS